MKPKEKLVLNGGPLFKFEQNTGTDSSTIPTTFTITITTTGFSKERHTPYRGSLPEGKKKW